MRASRVWERYFSHAYEFTADYGNSIVRPLGIVLVSAVLFALYYAFAAALPVRFPSWNDLWQAMSFSAARVFPFGPWGGAPDKTSLIGQYINANGVQYTPLKAFGFSFVATCQSLIAIVLLFLTALAIRRRFQIN